MKYPRWILSTIAGSLFFLNTYSLTLYAGNLKHLLKDNRIALGGWVNGGVNFNPSQKNGFNGPVIMADQANQFQLNQLNLFMQRAVVSEGNIWDFGGRFDFMFGTDAVFTQAFGVPTLDVHSGEPLERSNWDLDLCCASSRTYGIALPQAYLETYVPVGNGLNIKLGHFYSPMGYETVPAPDNFFYTRAYNLNVGEPFTHTGLLSEYKINKNWSVIGAAVTGSANGGWDGGWDKQLENWSGVAGFNWTSDNNLTSLKVIGSYGKTSTHSNEPWATYNIVLKHRINPKTSLALHHVWGYAGGVLLNNPKYNNVTKDTQWITLMAYLYYDVADNVSMGVRGEWFRDRDGSRNPSPYRIAATTNIVNGRTVSYAGDPARVTIMPADYYSATVGINWKAAKTLKLKSDLIRELTVRSNIRYDRVDAYHAPAYRPFAGNKDQILFSLDFILPF